ncbi:MAG TPA: hypothetical protein DIT18_03130 [Pseudomonas sp.]|nr:hypothetical protein [Pseudomonas sp.]
MTQKIDNLTSLRCFAAWSIVFYHLQGVVLPMPSMPQFALGVSFFFVLSGFILAVVYNGMTWADLPRFYLHRIARIWPVHLFMMAVVMFLFDPFGLLSEFWRPVILLNAVLLHAWIPQSGHVFSMNPVSWSISTELAFYLVFPLLVMFRPVWKSVSIVALLVGLLLLGIDRLGGPIVSSPPWVNSVEVFILQNPAIRLLEFAVGVLAGDLFVRRGALSRRGGTVLEMLVLATLAVFVLSNGSVSAWLGASLSPVIGLWYGQSGGLLVFAALIYVFALQRGALSAALKCRPLVFLGEISFCTYMVHYPIILYGRKSAWMDQAPWQVVALFVVLATLVASWLVWYSVERPGRKWIAGLYSPAARRDREVLRARLEAD